MLELGKGCVIAIIVPFKTYFLSESKSWGKKGKHLSDFKGRFDFLFLHCIGFQDLHACAGEKGSYYLL